MLIRVNSWLNIIEFSVFSVFSVAKNQSKTLIPPSKNQIFQKFLTHFPKTSYERRATRNGYIFVSKAQVALIIEGLFFYSLNLPEFIPGCTYTALLPGSVCLLALEFTLGVCLLACLPGAGGLRQKAASYLRAHKAQSTQKAQTINLEAKRKPLRGMNHEL